MVLLFFLILCNAVFFYPKAGEVVIKVGGGVRAVAEWSVPEGADPKEKGAVLWLHGLFQTHRMADPVSTQRELWTEAGFPVLSPTLSLGIDMRREPYKCDGVLDTTFEESVEEINRWIEWLKGKGIKKIVLAGHSMGGLQVLYFVSKYRIPEVKGVVAVAPSKGLGIKNDVFEKAERLIKGGRGKEIIKTGFFYCEEARVTARTVYSYYKERHLGKILKDIKIPVLIVWGTLDKRVEDLPGFIKPFAGKNVRIEKVELADHFFRDLFAEDLSIAVTEFLEEILSDQSSKTTSKK